MTTRNMRYEKDDYIIDNDNRVRFRKSTNLESDNEYFGVPSLPRIGKNKYNNNNNSKRPNKNKKKKDENVPKDDIRKLDHYIRVGLPQQIYDNYEALLVYELDMIKRFINYTARWSRTEYLVSCVNSKHLSSDISICLFFIGPVSAYFMGLAQFYRFLLPMIFGFLLEKLFNKKVKRPYNLDRRLVPGCVTFGPAFPQCDVLIATSCCLAIAFDSFNTFIYHPIAGWEYLFVSFLSFGYIFMISFSRFWGLANFPHQIIGSNILGTIICIATYHTHDYLKKTYKKPRKIDLQLAMLPVTLTVIFGFVVLMSRIETNDVKYLSIPQSEYKRVLTDILSEDHASGGIDGPGNSNITSRSVRRHYKRKLDPRRKDGFVKMMEQMERRNEMLYTTRLSEEEELRMAGF